MKKTIVNTAHVEGYLYNFDLVEAETGPNSKAPGTKYIRGNIQLATDADKTNIVRIDFSYVTATTKAGKPNATYEILKGIADGAHGCVMKGSESPAMLRVDGRIGVNSYYVMDNETGKPALRELQQFTGQFVHVVKVFNTDEAKRNVFDIDLLISSVKHKDGDPDRETTDLAEIRGAIIDDYNKTTLPVNLVVRDVNGMDYFEGLGASASNPVFTRVNGTFVSQTITSSKEVESAWGGPKIETTYKSQREYLVTWAQPDTYEFDLEETITADELKALVANRELAKQDLLTRFNDRQRAVAEKPTNKPAVSGEAFNF